MNPKFTADKDYYGTDDNKVVGPTHPARRRLIALQGHNVPEKLALQYNLNGPRAYDEVPEPVYEALVAAAPALSDEEITQKIAEGVSKATDALRAEFAELVKPAAASEATAKTK